jgi:fermentation-respiration switch protein FrsA (DUF1100 family)
MSSQSYRADLAPVVAPRPMLLIHGSDDDVLPAMCSRQIFELAREPKELRLFEGASWARRGAPATAGSARAVAPGKTRSLTRSGFKLR